MSSIHKIHHNIKRDGKTNPAKPPEHHPIVGALPAALLIIGAILISVPFIGTRFYDAFPPKVESNGQTVKISKNAKYQDLQVDFQMPGNTENTIALAYRTLASLGIDDGDDAADAAGKIAEWLRDNCRYDRATDKRGVDDAFKGSAVCSGYAKAYEVMCRLCSIECEFVTGYVAFMNEPHAWNRVYIGGAEYYVDTCLNSINRANTYPLTDHLWIDHTIDDSIFKG